MKTKITNNVETFQQQTKTSENGRPLSYVETEVCNLFSFMQKLLSVKLFFISNFFIKKLVWNSLWFASCTPTENLLKPLWKSGASTSLIFLKKLTSDYHGMKEHHHKLKITIWIFCNIFFLLQGVGTLAAIFRNLFS